MGAACSEFKQNFKRFMFIEYHLFLKNLISINVWKLSLLGLQSESYLSGSFSTILFSCIYFYMDIPDSRLSRQRMEFMSDQLGYVIQR